MTDQPSLFDAPEPDKPPRQSAPEVDAFTRETCRNCGQELRTSMAGWVHTKSGNSICYTRDRPERAEAPTFCGFCHTVMSTAEWREHVCSEMSPGLQASLRKRLEMLTERKD